jgi:hypothetical protein
MSTDDERERILGEDIAPVEEPKTERLTVFETMLRSNQLSPGEVVWFYITCQIYFLFFIFLYPIIGPHYQSHHLVLGRLCESVVSLECPRANIACAGISPI